MPHAFEPATLLALFQSNCSDADSPLDCRLHNILHVLVIAAVVLGVVLVIVVVLALRAYRRNKKAETEKQ